MRHGSHKPIRIYMGVLILGVNILYRFFCFFKLFLMIGKGLKQPFRFCCVNNSSTGIQLLCDSENIVSRIPHMTEPCLHWWSQGVTGSCRSYKLQVATIDCRSYRSARLVCK